VNTELPIDKKLQAKMAATQQNPRYHAEGNVLEHTRLVVQRYFELRDRFQLTEEEKDILYWAAVLHDLGKTRVTRYEDGRWTSPGHEKAGLPLAMDHLLRYSNLKPASRRKVLDLVRWHGMPLRFIRYQRPLNDLKLLGTRADLRLLGIFAIFDFHGRICEVQDEVISNIEHFQSVTVPKTEYEFAPYDTLQEQYRKWNLRHKNAAWKAIQIKDVNLVQKLMKAEEQETPPTFGKKVLLTVGPPLSGKTSFIEREHPGLFRVSMEEHGMAISDLGDRYYEGRKLIEFRHFLNIYLNRKRHVALDGRNIKEDFRIKITNFIREMHVEVEYLVFESPIDLLVERDQQREEPEGRETIEQMYHNMDLVHPWEAHHIKYIGDDE
jgi:predicted kinase